MIHEQLLLVRAFTYQLHMYYQSFIFLPSPGRGLRGLPRDYFFPKMCEKCSLQPLSPRHGASALPTWAPQVLFGCFKLSFIPIHNRICCFTPVQVCYTNYCGLLDRLLWSVTYGMAIRCPSTYHSDTPKEPSGITVPVTEELRHPSIFNFSYNLNILKAFPQKTTELCATALFTVVEMLSSVTLSELFIFERINIWTAVIP